VTGLRWTQAQVDAARARAGVPKPRASRSKYGSVREDGCDSRREARRWRELRLLLRTGELVWLARQVSFSLPGETEYRADFVYQVAGGGMVVEDVKSPVTRRLPAYRIKARQMRAIHGIEVREVE